MDEPTRRRVSEAMARGVIRFLAETFNIEYANAAAGDIFQAAINALDQELLHDGDQNATIKDAIVSSKPKYPTLRAGLPS